MKKRVLLFAILVLPHLWPANAEARLYRITRSNDTTDVTGLRGAIMDANKHGGANIIMLGQERPSRIPTNAPVVLHLTLAGADEDAARTGDLDITRGQLSIIGPAAGLTIDATGLGDRVFQVFPNASLVLENVTLVGGAAPPAQFGNFYGPTRDAEDGGAICNAGLLILKNCVITNNASGGGNGNPGNGFGKSGGDGGGIYNSGILWATGCTFDGNFTGMGVDGAVGGNGGGLKNDGTCLLTNCIFDGNQNGNGGGPAGNAIGAGGWGGSGGAIFNSGKMILNQCLIRANAAGDGAAGSYPSGWITIGASGGFGGSGGGGGGIFNEGQMQINFSTVCDNTAGNGADGFSYGSGGNGGAGGNGAGIFNTGQLSLNTSTISSNICGYGGAGGSGEILDGAPGGDGGSGGGIYNAGSLDSTSCTITLNQTGAGGNAGNGSGYSFWSTQYAPASGGNGGNGGGILNAAASTNAVLRNTLIALNLISAGGTGGTNSYEIYSYPDPPQTVQQIGNPGANGIGLDLAGDFTSQGFNLISIADDSTGFITGANADQIGSSASPIDPLLGPLRMNGGSTPTHALLPGSPAIDQGNSFGIHTDQRGEPRPYKNPSLPNAPGGDGSDIGAYELQ